ncbi:MAG: 3-dehydroquinate synthase [Caldilineae bacterium]|nr:MAG: 3-dehydroquinate synthase [Caldilineae bacterium]
MKPLSFFSLMPETAPPEAPLNIVLTGFMGVGKTAVGRAVAARLGREFVDMDDLIVETAGMSIPEIFERYGEDRFRSLETHILRQLAARRGLVIATGGGALVDAANRELMTRTSLVICLSASVSAIEARVRGDATRPLLASPDRRQRIVDLMNRRAAAYAEIPYRIDTTDRSVDEVADMVIDLANRGLGGVLRLPVATPHGAGYDILIGSGLLGQIPELLAQRDLHGHVAVISDEHVAPHWQPRLEQAFRKAGREAIFVTLPAGEAHKNLSTIARIYEELVMAGLDRRSIILALGGGVIGDMAGFVAATYLRGVHFVQVPTTLLAMVDASVGGKTGVDLPQGKNLVGAFKQPRLVVVDPAVLATLPAAEFRNGLAEVIKHAIIADPTLFAQLEGDGPESLESLLARALRVKIDIVQRDPFEGGERAHLNLGHTFGHAFEQVSGYRLAHGQGVAVGLVASAHLAALRGDCSPALPERIAAVVERLGLPTRLSGLAPEAVVRAMATDKKRAGRRLRFVLPREVGEVFVAEDVSSGQVRKTLALVLD